MWTPIRFPTSARSSIARIHRSSPELYKSSYNYTYLDDVARAPHVREVWCVFDNTAESHAQPNALHLMEQLRIRHKV